MDQHLGVLNDAQNAARAVNDFLAERVRAHGQAAAMSAKVGMFQVKADDARVMPVKRQSAPKQVRPVQGQGGHPRSVQRAPATSNSRALSSSSEFDQLTVNRDKGEAIAFPRAVVASGLFGRQQRSAFPRSFAASGRS